MDHVSTAQPTQRRGNPDAQTHRETEPHDSDLRRQAASLFWKFEHELGVQTEDLRQALGLGETYFARLRSEALGERRGASTKTFLNRKTVESLNAIHRLLADRRREPQASDVREETLPEYIERVRCEIAELENDSYYTLVAAPPPLESHSHQIRREVILAAHRGVKFCYAYPSQNVIDEIDRMMRDAKKQLDGAPSAAPTHPDDSTRRYGSESDPADEKRRMREKLVVFRRFFGWMGNIENGITGVKRKLFEDALQLANGADTYANCLRDQIAFHPMDWLPTAFNEKVVCIRRVSGDNTTIETRKEMVDATDDQANLEIYCAERKWKTFDYPISPHALRALIALASVPATSKQADRGWDELYDEYGVGMAGS